MAALLLLSIATQAPYGDLTRIGALSEDLFGWRAPQPAIAPRGLQASTLDAADIVVVGDSFSISPERGSHAAHVWQSRLVQAGFRVATLHWDHAQPLCPDFHSWLAAQGFHGQWVLFETIERELEGRLRTDRPCSKQPRVIPQAFTVDAPVLNPPVFVPNLHEKLLTGLLTHWHSWRARRATGPLEFKDPAASQSTQLQQVPDGCRRFSHPACDRVLFLAADEQRPRFQAAHLTLLNQAMNTAHPWRLGWLVIPNKTTYYLDPAPFQRVSAQLPPRQLGPNLMAALITEGAGQRDLYFGNDSHLSPRGSLLLGDTVLHWIQSVAPPAETAAVAPASQ